MITGSGMGVVDANAAALGVSRKQLMESSGNAIARTVRDVADDDDVIELVLETEEAYRMYSYAASPDEGDASWLDYGRESKSGEAGETMRRTLESYRVLAGDPEGE